MESNLRKNIIAIIFNDDLDVLIWKYNSSKPSWTLPKWWINDDETEVEWLFREIKEELNIPKDNLTIVHEYEKNFIKYFTQEEIDWKIKNKWEHFIWKSEKPFIIKFSWDPNIIDVKITNELSEFKFVKINDLGQYLAMPLIDFLDLDYMRKIINDSK